ncbi:integrase core domain-containing protein [Rhodococcus opacus]|uniref:integrase core domain-containing protein n=1 Tax=Rhodococcus opacus TaxID=37919 RepID=UPI0015FB6EDE
MSPGAPWNNGHIESLYNRLRKECLNRNHWTSQLEARVVIGDFKDARTVRAATMSVKPTDLASSPVRARIGERCQRAPLVE